MMGPKKQESTYSKDFFLKIRWWIMVHQKVPKLYFQSQFSMSKSNQFFSKKISSKNINLEDHFLLKTFFLDSIFEPLYFLRSMLILGQKSYFLEPTIFKILQPNWYCLFFKVSIPSLSKYVHLDSLLFLETK